MNKQSIPSLYTIIFATSFVILFITRPIFSHDSFPLLKFHGTFETLSKIQEIIEKKEKGAYLRFGDGDINLALGQGELLQSANQRLMFEMREAFSLDHKNVLRCLPLYCKELGGWESGMFPGNHESPYSWCLDILHKSKQLWNSPIIDVYSHAALHFSATTMPQFCINFLKFLKTNNCCLLIGNQNIPEHIRTLLFGEQCIFIPTPTHQSYQSIDTIEKECLAHVAIMPTKTYKIIVTAMGCSGRALQKRLWMKLDDVFLFDFGSLMDALCGWNTRAWIELTKFDEKTFLQKLEQSLTT